MEETLARGPRLAAINLVYVSLVNAQHGSRGSVRNACTSKPPIALLSFVPLLEDIPRSFWLFQKSTARLLPLHL